MYKVISPRSCEESAGVLQEYLNVRYSHPIPNRTVYINWGNSYIERTDPSLVFGNKREAVGRSSSKQVFFDLCRDLGTVPVVTEYSEPGVYQHHAFLSDGRGVQFVDQASEFVPGILSTKRVIGTEYRVYFCYNMYPMIFRKIKMEDDAQDRAVQCSTNGYGYTKQLQNIAGLKGILKEYTKKVSNRLELSYGAVDFIVEKDTHLVYVLESNSAPTLFLDEIADGFAKSISEHLFGGD